MWMMCVKVGKAALFVIEMWALTGGLFAISVGEASN